MQILRRERGRNHTDNILILDRDKCVILQDGEGRKERKEKRKSSGRKSLYENCTLYLLGNSSGEKSTAERALCYHL